MHEVNRPWIFDRLKRSLQLLACPPEIQLGKFADFVHVPDELALDFAHFRMVSVDNFRDELSGKQLSCLYADQSFSQMPKSSFSPNTVTTSHEWQQIRQLAAEALKAFGWPLDEPPRLDDEFVPA